jgi:hypothetical protein
VWVLVGTLLLRKAPSQRDEACSCCPDPLATTQNAEKNEEEEIE